jgi:hypothetical protein
MRRLLLTCVLFGCAHDLDERSALPTGDFPTFVTTIQPILAEHCANPSCHGRPERPLALFAVQQHRADPHTLFLEDPLSEDELRANHLRTLGFLHGLEHAEGCVLLSKPLAPSAGGSAHEGGAQFEDTSAQAYQALQRWVETVLQGAP